MLPPKINKKVTQADVVDIVNVVYRQLHLKGIDFGTDEDNINFQMALNNLLCNELDVNED